MKRASLALVATLAALCLLGTSTAYAAPSKVLTLPFQDPTVVLVQGWYYDYDPPNHQGIDFKKGAWEPFDVVAAFGGTLTCSSSAHPSYGNMCIIEHTVGGNTFYTLYGHLASFVSQGGPVAQGDKIGVAGATGAAGGQVHLHFEIMEDIACYSKSCRRDPYDIYSTAAHYPGGASFTTLGPGTWWANDPPQVAGQGPCDSGLALAGTNPLAAAKAIGMCSGVQSAKWVLPDGSSPSAAILPEFNLGHGLLSGFGPNVHPQEGARLLALSSGTARRPSDSGYQNVVGYDKQYTCSAPSGFPQGWPSCPGIVPSPFASHDGVALEFALVVPSGSRGFSFDANYYTTEFPAYVCNQYDDYFAALLSPPPAGRPDGNVIFDTTGNAIGVNADFIAVCTPQVAGGKTFSCPLGIGQLEGTGFEGFAATGWLETTVPAVAGSNIVIRFAAWDNGDAVLDSTTLIDNWRWRFDAVLALGTTRVSSPK